MEDFQSQERPGDGILVKQKISRDLNQYGYSGSRHRTFRAGRGCFAIPRHRQVVLSLGLLNAALLIAAVVIGAYCAKARYLQVPSSAATPYLIEMNYLRNHSAIIKATLEAKANEVKERINYEKLKLQIKQNKVNMDRLQGQIETLRTEKEKLRATQTSLEENCGRCQLGWNLIKSSCYYFSSRLESNSKKNWLDSRADCISKGGDLLVIDNLEEQLLVSATIPVQRTSSGQWWERGYWIGLTDAVLKGTWVWVNNVTEVQTVYWRSGQPKSDGPQSGDCAALLYSSDTNRMWYNGNCQDHQYNWICEAQPSSI